MLREAGRKEARSRGDCDVEPREESGWVLTATRLATRSRPYLGHLQRAS